jgi:pimeloyl-ACP methyl ester carboxylesterase
MSSITRAYAPSRYGQLHYRIAMPAGPSVAPPLLCLHQTPSNSFEWLPIMPLLAQGRVVIAPDTPGYGMSDCPPEPAAITDFAEVMADLMAHLVQDGTLAAGPYDVMGAHTGSLVATQMAVVAPAMVRKLVLFGLAAYPADERARRAASLREKFPMPGPDLTHVEQLWGIFGHLGDVRMTPEQRHVAMAECLRLGSRMPWGYFGVYDYDFIGALQQVQQAALVINPQDDLWAVTQASAPLLRAGQVWNLPGKAHGFLYFDAAMVAARIVEFLG